MSKNRIYNTWMAGILASFLSIGSLTFSSCNSWLDVVPDDRISETVVFDDEKGFQKLLNGLYSGMTSTSLYGRNLSVGAIDVLAQYYDTYNFGDVYSDLYEYNYSTEESKDLISDIWGDAYSLISNANTLIAEIEKEECPLSERQKQRMKGEALTVRAFLHFDLLRLFGPVPTDLSGQAIPYQTSTELDVQPFETGTEIMTKIKADLTNAISLLKESEPLLIPDKYEADEIISRPYRMNYFTAKAILARAYLWEGNKSEAYNTATTLIDEASAIFPLSDDDDFLFVDEMLLGLYNISRESDIYNVLFSTELEYYERLHPAGESLSSGRLMGWFDDQNDYRYKMWGVDEKCLYLQKYRPNDESSTLYNSTIPLVRMSEMYLIAAECASTVDAAATWLNTLRNHRYCFSLEVTSKSLADYIYKEYSKEFVGEGQLFFYMKRNAFERVPNGHKESGQMSMELGDYVIPLPDGETSMREGLD
ncbi:MAG: RagB/SusD family nutrient uptake outer membrane protein [Bacteroides sp.]|nr:RagB/SusD family nutrient uptake outer membrane protein [Bacteroides sp.]